MIVAGSVLAMLLMGLAVEGFLNPADEEDDDSTDVEEGGDASDQSGTASSALSDLLLAAEGDGAFEDDEDFAATPTPSASLAFNYIPLEQVELDDARADGDVSGTHDDFAFDESSEGIADSEWASIATDPTDGLYIEVEDLTGLEDGSEVSFVTNFNTETDSLVLEFEGTTGDTPEIAVDHDFEDGAALVLANGVPVTLVDGASDLTTDHIRVVMTGDSVLDATTDVNTNVDTQSLPNTAELGGVLTEGTQDATELEQPTRQVLLGADQMFPDLGNTEDISSGEAQDLLSGGTTDLLSDEDGLLGLDPLLDDAVDTVLDPIVTIVDEVSDGLPLPDELMALLDDMTTSLSDMGSTSDMLNARGDVDPAFGTGGEDAFTGTFNNDLVAGGSGQDALFGDEGDDTLDGATGNDELHGDTGNDLLLGGAGIDFLDGGEGDDTLDGGADRDLLFGGDGDDVLYGGAAADFLQGGMGADTMNGGSGNDVLNGTFGNSATGMDQDDGDVLWGGDGDDTLILGRDDVAHGGEGSDTFVGGEYIENADVAGHVADFDPSEDRIEVIFDPDVNPNPRVEVQDFADGSGADILLNGSVILSVSGAQGMDPNLIDLRAVA